jgi:hypothetical protein
MAAAKRGIVMDGGDRVKKKKPTTLFDAMKQRSQDKRSDIAEGQLSKRENSAQQNGEDF